MSKTSAGSRTNIRKGERRSPCRRFLDFNKAIHRDSENTGSLDQGADPAAESGTMAVRIRSRLMIAALVFALAWALGFAVHHAVHMSLAVLCLAIGSLALSYLVWEYHRAWRLRPSTTSSTAVLGLRTWPGISVDGAIVRPEYITAALAFVLCVLGMIMYFEASSHPPLPVFASPPSSLLPESKPLD
jgi:hypothetical protein